MTNTPHLLVVGGGGFIGRHVVEHGKRLGWTVTGLSLNGSNGIAADVADMPALQAALAGSRFDYVINCGGYIDHSPYSQGGEKVMDAHFSGVRNLVTALGGSGLKCFVNIGSSDEYGSAPAPQSEAMRESPISPYSFAKTASAHFLQTLHRTEKFPAVTLRLFLTYGPGQDNRRFLPQIIKGCLENQSFAASKGEQLRDFCYIDDTVAAIFLTLAKSAAHGEIINIASGTPVSIKQVIEQVRTITGGGNPKYGEIAYRPSENMQLYADISKAKELLAWQPKVSLESGLRQTIDWVKGRP